MILFQSDEEEARNWKLSEESQYIMRPLFYPLLDHSLNKLVSYYCQFNPDQNGGLLCVDYSHATLDKLLEQHIPIQKARQSDPDIARKLKGMLKRRQMREVRKYIVPLAFQKLPTGTTCKSFVDLLEHNPLYHKSILDMVAISSGINQEISCGEYSGVETLMGQVQFAVSKSKRFTIHYLFERTGTYTNIDPFYGEVYVTTKSQEVLDALAGAKTKKAVDGEPTKYVLIHQSQYPMGQTDGESHDALFSSMKLGKSDVRWSTFNIIFKLLRDAAGRDVAARLGGEDETTCKSKIFWLLDLLELMLLATVPYNQKPQLYPR